MIAPLFLFSIVWSLGASCDKAGRGHFDKWFREQVSHLPGVGAALLATSKDWLLPAIHTVHLSCTSICPSTWLILYCSVCNDLPSLMLFNPAHA
jgi:hypothetical protein